jgi:SAM-dependent methyltransferase
MIEDPLPWDYLHRARELIPSASAMLDLCTGGGERLADLAPLPRLTVATESYRPNVPIAFCRLRKVRAAVIHVDEEVQNSFGPSSEKDHQHPTRRLPLADASFDLIVCRHGSYSSGEVARLLRPGGLFLSQLVGEDNYPHLNARLGGIGTVWIPPGSPPPPTLEQHGLQVLERQEARPKSIFKDIGAIVYYLKAVPWQIADFSVEAYMNPLRELHKQMRDSGGLQTHYHRRLLLARKPV